MGTFIIKALSVTGDDITHWNDHGGTALAGVLVANDNKYVFWSYGLPGPPVDATVRVNTSSGPSIYLDGSLVAVGLSQLPAGFAVVSAQVEWYGTNSPGAGDTFFVQANILTEAAGTITGVNVTNLLKYSFAFPAPTILDIVNNGCGVRAHSDNSSVARIDRIQITGTYSIVSSSWTLPVTTNIKAGDKVVINNPVGSAPTLKSVSQLQVQYIDSNGKLHIDTVLAQDFIFWGPYQIIFYFPQFGNLASGSTVYLFAIGNGTEFSGSVLVGALTILFVDASGVYTLIQLKSTDTIYNAARNGTTTDVNIPDPIVETAFIP